MFFWYNKNTYACKKSNADYSFMVSQLGNVKSEKLEVSLDKVP